MSNEIRDPHCDNTLPLELASSTANTDEHLDQNIMATGALPGVDSFALSDVLSDDQGSDSPDSPEPRVPKSTHSGLFAIHLYDSYIKHKFCEAQCFGHANYSGGNGAGKTSLLNLVPIFYGMQPSKLIKRVGDKQDFAHFYLPNVRSLIAFEYLKDNAHKCVIVCRSGEGFIYYFVDAPAAQIFTQTMLDLLKQLADVKSWLTSVVAQDVFITRQIGTTQEYAHIIQNNIVALKRRAKTKNNNTLTYAQRFALVSGSETIEHIEALTSVLISRANLLAKFKNMLLDVFIKPKLNITQSPYRPDDHKIVDTLRTLAMFNANTTLFTGVFTTYSKLQSDISHLLAYDGYCVDKQVQLDEDIAALQETIAITQTTIETLTQAYQEQASALQATILQQQTELDVLDADLDVLEARRDEFESEDKHDIFAKQADYDNLALFREEAQQAEEQFAQLTEEVAHEEAQYKERVADTKETARAQVQTLKDTNTTLQSEIQLQETNFERRNAEREKTKATDKQAIADELAPQIQEYQSQINALSTQAGQVTQPTPEEQLQLDDTLAGIELQREVLATHRDSVSNEKDALRQAEQQQNTSQHAERVQRDKLKDFMALYDKQEQQLNPVKASLRAYLNKHDPQWRETIGKVIDETLLTQTNLEPATLDYLDGLYGLHINLDRRTIPAFAMTDNQLREAIEETERKLSHCNTRLDEIVLEHAEAKQRVNRFKQNITAQEQQIMSLHDTLETSEGSHKRLIDDIKQAGLSRKSAVDEQIDTVKASLTACREEIKARQKQVDNQFIEESLRLSQAQSDFNDSRNEQIRTNNREITRIQEDLQQSLKHIKAAYDAVLKEKALDPAMIQTLRQKKQTSAQKVKDTQQYLTLIQEYQQWLQTQWVRKSDLDKKRPVLVADIERITREKQHKEHTYKATVKVHKQQLSEYKAQLKTHRDNLDRIERALAKITDKRELTIDKVTVELPLALTLDQVLMRLAELVSDIDSGLVDMKRLIKSIGEKLARIAGTQNMIVNYWQELIEKRFTEYQGEASDNYYLTSHADVRKLQDYLPEVTDTVVSMFDTKAESYIRFFESMQTLSGVIKNTSNTLANNINTHNPFPDLDEVTIALTSRFQELEAFTYLKQFTAEFKEYKETTQMEDQAGAVSEELIGLYEIIVGSFKSSHFEDDLSSLMDVNISLKENGRKVVIRTDNDLKNASSTGLSTLAIMIIFLGITRYLCQDRQLTIHWPLDELGTLSEQNSIELFKLMNEQNISIFSAQPSPPVALLSYFTHKYQVDFKDGFKHYVVVDEAGQSQANPLLMAQESQHED